MFRILIRYVTLTFDDAFSSVDESDVILKALIIYCIICLMFTNNHRVLHNIFSCNTVYILFISVGCKSKLNQGDAFIMIMIMSIIIPEQ